MTALPAQVALIDNTGSIRSADLSALATALNEQAQYDFSPIWAAYAHVAVYAPGTKPQGAWAIHIEKYLNQPGALGYHTDQHNQPVSYVELTSDYSVTASHEFMEMLADQFGNRMHTAGLPYGLRPSAIGVQAGAQVNYLVEVADPPEMFSYVVNGVRVSDFILPPWYRSTPGEKYSFAGNCKRPLEILNGGYCSFSRADGEWFQVFNQVGTLQVNNLGKFSKADGSSLREWVDQQAREYRSTV